jgi:hypothetical protein
MQLRISQGDEDRLLTFIEMAPRAFSAESALLTTEHIAHAKKPIEAPMKTPIINIARNMLCTPSKKRPPCSMVAVAEEI